VDLWRLLAALLAAPRRWALRPARLVWEVRADPHGTRCGLWVPPGINPTAVVRILNRTWPGARTTQMSPPAIPARGPAAGTLAAVEVRATRADWLPIVEDPPAAVPFRRGGGVAAAEDDRVRAVFDGLAAAGRTAGDPASSGGTALLQVHVCRAPARRLAGLRRATVRLRRTEARRTGTARAAALGAALLSGLLRTAVTTAVEVISPRPAAGQPTHGRPATDPYAAELGRAARAKLGAGPHLLVAIRATTTGPSLPAARAAAADIGSGFGLLSAHVTTRRLRRGPGVYAARWRWVPEQRMTLVTVAEAAALAGIPAEPSAYGLPAAASRRRPPGREVYRPAEAPPRTAAADTTATLTRRPGPAPARRQP
jgi:hypothetical protein